MDELRWVAMLGWVAVLSMTIFVLMSTRDGIASLRRLGTAGFVISAGGAMVLAMIRFSEVL